MTSRFDLITNATGSVTVRNQQANITLDPVEYAFLGNSTVTIKIRQDSITGPVLLESPPITIIDNSELISVTANTYSVPEGQSVLFSILTRNVPDRAVIAYVAEAVSGNITANDLSIGNVSALAGGFSEIIDNIATFTVFANVDNTIGEAGEKFRVSLRAGNTNGLILGYSDNVTIKDTSEFFNITSDKSTVDYNTNVTFTVQTFGLPDGANLFYFTAGDVTNFDSANAQANTGYVVTSSNIATVTLRPIAPENSSLPFNLLIRDANTNLLLAGSSGVNSIGENTLFSNITGGVKTTIGNYNYHVFNTSHNNFTIDRVGARYNTLEIVAIGAGSPGGSYWGKHTVGGGGGQVQNVTYSMPEAMKGQQVSLSIASSSPSGQSPSTLISFGAASGGYTIVSKSANQDSGWLPTGESTNGGPTIDTLRGGGGAGGNGSGGYVQPSSGAYVGGTGGIGATVPWLYQNNVGPQLGVGYRFGAGGGGGASIYAVGRILNYGGPGGQDGGGDGGDATGTPAHHWYDSPGGSYYESYTRYTTSAGGAGAQWAGNGGGGGSVGFETLTTSPSSPARDFQHPYSAEPGGYGSPGAVIMRYRIAED